MIPTRPCIDQPTNPCESCPCQCSLFFPHQRMEESLMSMLKMLSHARRPWPKPPGCHGPTAPPRALGIGQMRIHPLCRVQKPGAQQFGGVLSIVLAAREEPSVAQRDYLRMSARREKRWHKLLGIKQYAQCSKLRTPGWLCECIFLWKLIRYSKEAGRKTAPNS
jgi:hypothetical protein